MTHTVLGLAGFLVFILGLYGVRAAIKYDGPTSFATLLFSIFIGMGAMLMIGAAYG